MLYGIPFLEPPCRVSYRLESIFACVSAKKPLRVDRYLSDIVRLKEFSFQLVSRGFVMTKYADVPINAKSLPAKKKSFLLSFYVSAMTELIYPLLLKIIRSLRLIMNC